MVCRVLESTLCKMLYAKHCEVQQTPLEDKLAQQRSVSTLGTRGGSITRPEHMSTTCLIRAGESISRRLKLCCVEKVRASFSQHRPSTLTKQHPPCNYDLHKRGLFLHPRRIEESDRATLCVSVTNGASWDISVKVAAKHQALVCGSAPHPQHSTVSLMAGEWSHIAF